MDNLLRFLVKYELLMYLLLAFVAILFLRKVFVAWKEWRSALFGLEKENSQRKFNQGLTTLIFCGLLGSGLFIITTFVAPAVPNLQQVPTATVNLTAQPTSNTTETPEVAQTTTGLIPTLTSLFEKGCIPEQIEWTNPTDGDTISGTVELTGTVNVTDLGYYKYEYAQSGSDKWTTIAAGNTKIVDGALGGSWNTSDLIPGDYQLRLVVTDHQNNILPECTIKISITAP